jgi:hypothetical protein
VHPNKTADFESSMASTNMSDAQSLMHAAMMNYDEAERVAKLPKPKPKPTADPEYSAMWQNLAVLDEQSKKIDNPAKPYVGDIADPEEARKAERREELKKQIKEANEAAQEGDGLFDTNFDDASLSLYTAELSDNVSRGEEDVAFHEIEKEQKR